MKARFVLVFLVLGLALAACDPVSSAGNMALSSFAAAPVPTEEVDVKLDKVAEGTEIRLSYLPNENVKIELVGTDQTVIIQRGLWDPYTNKTIIWVRSNGVRMHLVDAVRASLDEPIQGTVHLEKDKNGADLFVVYKDASMIPAAPVAP